MELSGKQKERISSLAENEFADLALEMWDKDGKPVFNDKMESLIAEHYRSACIDVFLECN